MPSPNVGDNVVRSGGWKEAAKKEGSTDERKNGCTAIGHCGMGVEGRRGRWVGEDGECVPWMERVAAPLPTSCVGQEEEEKPEDEVKKD